MLAERMLILPLGGLAEESKGLLGVLAALD